MTAQPDSPFAPAPELAQRYQHELELAMARYRKAVSMADNPPDVTIGQSPKEVIWTRNKAKLYHYTPVSNVKQRYATPLMFIYALINKPYVMDLRPGSSLIEFLVGEGYEIYLLDWGTAGPEDAHLRLDDYIFDYLPRAVKHVLRHSGAAEISVLGYCIGGALTACFVASHQQQLPIKNMILMATPIDFSAPGLFQKWLDPAHFDVNRIIAAYGNMPADMIDFGSKLLKPFPNFIGTFTGAFDKLWDDRAIESWLSMQKWVNDGVPFAGEAFKQWIHEFYQGNKLTQGTLVMRGKPVLLSNITANVYNIIAQQDHIVLPPQSEAIMQHVSSTDKEQIVLKAGHVGLLVGRRAKENLWKALDGWLAKRSGKVG